MNSFLKTKPMLRKQHQCLSTFLKKILAVADSTPTLTSSQQIDLASILQINYT